MSFKFKWGEFSPIFIEETKSLLTKSLNKNFNELPPNLVGDIVVTELDFGKKPPVLEVLQVVDLDEDTFKAIFNMTYDGDLALTFQTLVQANPLGSQPPSIPTAPSLGILMANKHLIVPMFLKISALQLKGIIVLSISKKLGVTLIFKNEPLVSVKVSSSFDSVVSVQKKLQSTIEEVLRKLLREELPKIVHEMSIREIKREQLKLEKERILEIEQQKNLIEIRARLLLNRKIRSQSTAYGAYTTKNSTLSGSPNSFPYFIPGNFTAPVSVIGTEDLPFSTNDFSSSNNFAIGVTDRTDSGISIHQKNVHSSFHGAFSNPVYSESQNSTSLNGISPTSTKTQPISEIYNGNASSISYNELHPPDYDNYIQPSQNLLGNISSSNPVQSPYADSSLLSTFLDDEYKQLRRPNVGTDDSDQDQFPSNQENYVVNPTQNSNAHQLARLMSSGHTLTPYTRVFENATFRYEIRNDTNDKGLYDDNNFYIGSPTSVSGIDNSYYPLSTTSSIAPTPTDRPRSYSISVNNSYQSLHHPHSTNRHSKPIKKNVIKIPGFHLFSSGSPSNS
ncbi:Mitochondrial distribution and morphology protein 34 [Smittium mucronatum]|uniref:Mitochondrial distribution and morphology protein 34 n=1 Tax=Smittium mucronatum TaxID=133383 RepID=A0A1R0H359_9FUNG|nr:Mitochondrial distribution and morphology protein 34 [Smittium mucronatum]